MDSIKVGDLVILKGFNKKIDSIPIGVVVSIPTSKHYKIEWVNKELTERWALTSIVNESKIEKLT